MVLDTKYKITVYTGDKPGAGTDGNVYIILFGENGDSGEKFLDSKENNFERKKQDQFVIETPCLGRLDRIRIGHDYGGISRSWFLDKVIIYDCDNSITYTFQCQQWLSMDEDDGQIFRDLFPGYSYIITVSTGDYPNAGTDANVFVLLHNGKKKQDSGKVWLSDWKFKRGMAEIFDINLQLMLSPLTSLKIGHDDTGLETGWYCEQVIVYCPNTGIEQFFPCRKWLSTSEDDGLIQRTLYEDTGRRKKKDKKNTWNVWVKTSDINSAGTTANVRICLYGKKGKSKEIQLDNKGDFKKGHVDHFKAHIEEIGTPYKLRVYHDNTGWAAGWHLDRINMEIVGAKEKYAFKCNRWLADYKDDFSIVRELPAQGPGIKNPLPLEKYKVQVFTGTKSMAGTNANVYVNIFGERGDTSVRFLKKSQNMDKFERGKMDEFVLEAVSVLKLTKIRIGHDGKGIGAGWYLDKVVVSQIGEKKYNQEFVCQRWLAVDMDDGLIEREITASGAQMLAKLLDPEQQPMEIETRTIYERERGSSGQPGVGTIAIQVRSGEGKGEPMDTSFENLPAHNVMDAQIDEVRHFRGISDTQPHIEPRFRGTPAIPSQTEPRPKNELQFGETKPLSHPNGLDSPLEGLSKTLKVVIKRDLFDGRLISLDESQIKEIMKVGNIKEILLKAKGAQVFATQEKVPVFNTKLVIKQLQIDKIDVDRMKSITNEKLASRILHFGIVPLLAFYDDLHIDQHVTGYYYFVSPYFEGGTLFKAIKEDTAIIDSSDGHVRMCHKTRLKIIYQVASAISYLHTPVEGFRNDVLHMDIKSPNIVLDLMYNARLIDFGLAREMKEPNDSLLLTESTICGTEGYHPTTKFNRLTKFHDYHNFGVVIRELLTGLHPTLRVKDSTLRTMSKFSLTSMIQKKIWRKSKLSDELSDDLLTLAESCIESIAQNAVENTFKISDILNKLDSLMREESADKWTRTAAKDCEKCEVCVVNNAVEESGYLEHDPPLCQLKINVCASCMRNSFLNPIMCHTCGNKLRPFIGENWGAILIAGNDKREKVAESFTEDVSRLRDVITSRSVPVMCIRKEKIEVVAPIKPGNEDNEMWIKVQRAFGKLKKQNITTLMVAYSGHHGFRAKQKAEGTNDTDQSQNGLERSEPEKADILQEEGIFILSENESMKDVDLCNEIQQLTTVDKVLVFEDCCHGDAMTHALKGKRVVQFNSSTTRTKSLVNSSQKKSQFIDALIKALTATDDKKREGELYQHANCQLCVNIADELFKKTFLTLETLHIFISNYIDHCKSTGLKSVSHPTFSTQNILGKDSILAYRYHFPVAFHFKIKKPKGVEIKSELIFLNEYENLLKLKEFLLRKLLGDDDTTKYLVEKDQLKAYAAVVSIQVETGPREVHLNEIDSLEQASAAWTSRRELIAQIRNVTKIDFQNHAADIVSPKEVEVIFKELCLKPQHCAFNPSEEQVRLLIDADNLQHCVKQIHGKLERFGISQSLDHIDRVLRKKHDDVSNVKVHIVLPKINVSGKRQFGPLILYQLQRPSAEKES
ncbi:uncharacterized protein LOC128211482 [Mya arenaria]|nr:uncharacterized protein LOC128211482 [Mya arenaria]